MIEIRRALLEDAATIIATRQKAWAATYRGIYPDAMIDDFDWEWHLEAEMRRLSHPDFYCHLVMDKGKCVGYLSYGPVCTGVWKDFRFRLHSLYLLPSYQRMGLGKRLFQLAQQACEEMGYRKLFLDCHPHNSNALSFYVHMGGVICQIDSGHKNPQEDACTLEFHFT